MVLWEPNKDDSHVSKDYSHNVDILFLSCLGFSHQKRQVETCKV